MGDRMRQRKQPDPACYTVVLLNDEGEELDRIEDLPAADVERGWDTMGQPGLYLGRP